MLQALDEAAVVLDHSIAQPRPRYFAFVASSGLEIAVLGDALAACHDVNLAVVSGAADLVERQTLEWLGQAFGYPVATGTFSSGGTGLEHDGAGGRARARAAGLAPRGLSGRPCALYASADVHESVKRAAELLGIGRDRVRAIPIDARRRMQVEACAEAIDADRTAGVAPIAVVATAGTTLTGAVDPLDELADVCAQRGVWLHVDGAYGLPAALVESHAPLFRGLARADSVTVDAHKWLFVPKACGVLMVREAEWLERAFSHEATYVPTSSASRTPSTARSSTRARSARSSSGWRCACTAGRLPQRDRAQPLRGAPVRRPRQGARRAGAARRARALRRAVPPRRDGPAAGRAQPRAGRRAARRRPRLRLGRRHRRHRVPAALLRQLPDEPEDVRVLRDVVLELGAKLA